MIEYLLFYLVAVPQWIISLQIQRKPHNHYDEPVCQKWKNKQFLLLFSLIFNLMPFFFNLLSFQASFLVDELS